MVPIPRINWTARVASECSLASLPNCSFLPDQKAPSFLFSPSVRRLNSWNSTSPSPSLNVARDRTDMYFGAGGNLGDLFSPPRLSKPTPLASFGATDREAASMKTSFFLCPFQALRVPLFFLGPGHQEG